MIIAPARPNLPASPANKLSDEQAYGLEPSFVRYAMRTGLAVLLPSMVLWFLAASNATDAEWFVRWKSGRLFQVLFGHWVCPFILWFFSASLSYLLIKGSMLRADRRCMALLLGQVLPRGRQYVVPGESGKDTYQRISAQLRTLFPDAIAQNFLLCRLAAALGSDGTRDEAALEASETARMLASYALPRYVAWAIPMWGLIGTVIGISEAVSHFSAAMSSGDGQAGGTAAALQQHLPLVTGGLAAAFDATFVALLLSLPVMLLITWTEKAEEEYLLEVREQWRKVQPMVRELKQTTLGELTMLNVVPAPADSLRQPERGPERDSLSEELHLLVLQVKALQETMSELRESRAPVN